MRQARSVALACCLIATPLAAGELSVTILDELGRPAAARVYLLDRDGQPIFPTGCIAYDKVRPDGISERHFVPRGGVFTAVLKAGSCRLTVERGKEYSPESMTVAIPEAGKVSRTIRLHRWIDMARRGWYAGDMHLHRPLTDLAALMEAEDLGMAIPMTRWRANLQVSDDPDVARFAAGADQDGYFPAGEDRFFPVWNEELEPRASALLASRMGRDPAPLDYPLASFGRAVRARGGLSDSEKPSSWELPALAAVGACQTVGLANNHLWRSGTYLGAWGAWPDAMPGRYPQSCVGFVEAGFDMYAALLNAGLPLKLSAGTASGVHPVPPGWSRIYVHTARPLAPGAWFAALLEGRSFVTTGPMLLLKVNGREPGEEIREDRFPVPLTIEVEMLSPRAIDSAEIVINGEARRVRLAPGPAPHSYRGTLKLAVKTSAWITARWIAARGGGTCDSAHTSPMYVRLRGKPVPLDASSVRMLLDRVGRLLTALEAGDTGGAIQAGSAELRNQTLQYFREARGFYAGKLHEAEQGAR